MLKIRGKGGVEALSPRNEHHCWQEIPLKSASFTPTKDINPALCKANNEAQQSSAPFLIRTHNLREAITMSYLQGHRYGILTI